MSTMSLPTPGAGYLYHTSGLDFVAGHCDVCKQKNVKVTAFHCKSHFYCRSCLEFAPKFRRSKDFSCPTCCEPARRRTSENLEEVDKFMRTQTDGHNSQFEEVVFSVGGPNSWGSESDDESDLAGNNDEWENLLQATHHRHQTTSADTVMTTEHAPISPKTKSCEADDREASVKFITKPGIMGMAPATSYLQLKLPTADKFSSGSSSSGSSCTTPSQTSSVDIPPPVKPNPVLLRNSKNRKTDNGRSASSVSSNSGSGGSNKSSKCGDQEDGDRLVVKGSATVARGNPRHSRWIYDASPENYTDETKKRPNTPVSSRTGSSLGSQTRTCSGTSFDCWMDELGTVEGPSFKDNEVSFSSQEYIPETEKDDFWDI